VSLDGGVFINDSEVIIADIEASNGVIHVIDSVLVPAGFELVMDEAPAPAPESDQEPIAQTGDPGMIPLGFMAAAGLAGLWMVTRKK
ncbi:MAG: fasciclin domain-containing protein, partial [Bacillota bacterium]|nr:fasciclin domain-containing protein [Bacillota bacterium]